MHSPLSPTKESRTALSAIPLGAIYPRYPDEKCRPPPSVLYFTAGLPSCRVKYESLGVERESLPPGPAPGQENSRQSFFSGARRHPRRAAVATTSERLSLARARGELLYLRARLVPAARAREECEVLLYG